MEIRVYRKVADEILFVLHEMGFYFFVQLCQYCLYFTLYVDSEQSLNQPAKKVEVTIL